MKISNLWLKEYVTLPPEVTAAELAQKLTFAGLEVEGVTSLAAGLDKVVVGQILERKQHPNADRLSLTVIDVGGPEKLEIVCGAQNIKAGQKIPVAMVGAKIPNGLEIKPAKIRNVPSQGMLCSLDELLFPKDWQSEDGIFILPENAIVGMPLAEHLGRNDVIMDVNVTPNRGDALSHFGVARDVAALYGLSAKLPEVKVQESAAKWKAEVKVPAGIDGCPAYHGRVIAGVKVGPSPEWLRARLESVGLRSINNVVDVTAFVMMEMGQPLHAFDAAKLGAGEKTVKICVRHAKSGEKFTTLADKTVDLLPGDLVIAAGEKENAVALAGVMGGKNSEVDDSTTTVFLESAEFHPVQVRKTGRRLNLLTDAGYRFERGVDSGRIEWALDRATDLIVKVAGGVAEPKVCSPGIVNEPLAQIRLSLNEIERLLGKAPELQRVIQILRGLGIPAEVAAGEKGVVSVQVPRWRKDIKRSVDLIEEVARIWGFENLQSQLPLGGFGEGESKDSRRRSYFQVRRIRRHLASLGFFEALNYGFTSPEVLAKAHSAEEMKDLVTVANPVTSDYSVMKPCLLTGLLENLRQNFAHRHRDLRLFEMRRVFRQVPKGLDAKLDTGVEERVQLALLMTGAEVDEFWQGKPEPVDFYSLKGALESVFEMLGATSLQFQPGAARSFLHPGQSAALVQGNKTVGVIGRIHPRAEKNFELDQDVYYAEIDVETLVTDERRAHLFKEFSNFPLVERDFSAEVSESITAQKIRQVVTRAAKPLLKDFNFFDVYKGSRITEGHVSYAFRVVLGAIDHTLTDAEISQTQEKIMKELQKEVQAKFAGLP
jgi:phenylalanyl-tRNA synthetase beta chain